MNKQNAGFIAVVGGLVCIALHGPLALSVILIIGGGLFANRIL